MASHFAVVLIVSFGNLYKAKSRIAIRMKDDGKETEVLIC